MSITITLNQEDINRLNLAPVQAVVEPWLKDGSIGQHEQEIRLDIQFPREVGDPRELSEIPEVRAWFIRLAARYPWLPFLLDWEAQELGRYAAMLVPHQFSPSGIEFNPEAMEIFITHQMFVLTDWMQQQGIASRTKLKFMAQVLGYELEDSFFDLLDA